MARRATRLSHGIQVIFGNNGFLQDPKVRILRRLLKLKEIEELGMGVDSAVMAPF